MRLGYNTNGLAHHGLFDAVELLAEIGYRSVAITVDHGTLAPDGWAEQIRPLRERLRRLGLRSVIETGARFLLDPRRKHEPTLVSASAEERARRIAFYGHAIRCAGELESDCVSVWSGVPGEAISRGEAWECLAEGLGQVLDAANKAGVTVAFEPEPGMLVDTFARLEALLARVDATNLGVTLDVGHVHCAREPMRETILHWRKRLVNVHLEDMRVGRHEHLMFGEGEIDFPVVLAALAEAGYQGGLHVELSRHSHEGPAAARRAYDFLAPLIGD